MAAVRVRAALSSLCVCSQQQRLLEVFFAESWLCICCRFSSSPWHSVFTILSAVFVDFLAIGVAIATVGWCAPFPISSIAPALKA